jgi:hypothetical protein
MKPAVVGETFRLVTFAKPSAASSLLIQIAPHASPFSLPPSSLAAKCGEAGRLDDEGGRLEGEA